MSLEPSLRQALARFVPSGMIDRLDAPDNSAALNDVLQHINSLHKAAASFLPLYLTDDEGLLSSHYRALRPGTFMFADVSGFTALSEKLQMQNTAEGAENLTLIMNQFFARMLEILANCDGMLIKFAGDALLAFFPAAEVGTDNPADAGKAVRTAIRMQRAMHDFQPIHDPRAVEWLGGAPMSLSMSIGVARGHLFETLVGNALQREHIIQGALPRLTMEAESVGVRDDVIVPESLATLLAGHFTFQPLRDGFYQVIDDLGDTLGDYEFDLVRRRRAKSSAIFLNPEDMQAYLREKVARLQAVTRYISPAVLHELVVGGNYHIHSENRSATIMFIYATGFSELLEAWGASALESVSSLVERYYNLIHQIATSEGGAVTRTDPYQSGIKILITFGALVSHPDDPQRAIEVALETNRSLAHLNARLREGLSEGVPLLPRIEHRIGIAHGRTFSGEVGWKARREYTVMGDEVNLAARLMARAKPGEILISERVQRRVEGIFQLLPAPAQPLKGKSQPVRIYEVIGRSPLTPVKDELPLIGHDLILHTLTLALRETMTSGQRGAYALLGDSGIGKTRIAREVVRSARALDFRVAWATCQPRASRRTTWDHIVSDLLDLDAVTPAEGQSPLDAQRARLSERLRALDLQDLETALSLLCFGGMTPDDDADNLMSPAQVDELADIYKRFENVGMREARSTGIFKRVRSKLENKTKPDHTSRNLWLRVQSRIGTMETVARLINRLAQDSPLLIVIDGLENEHPNALGVLRHVLDDAALARVCILLIWEPPIDFDLPAQRIIVPDLSADETHLLTMELLNVRELGSRLAALIWERTNGRPLFIESFVRTLIENDCLDRDAFRAELHPQANIDVLPENVRDLMISRYDRLPPEVQNIVRAASIFNGGFTYEMLTVATANAERNAVPLAEALKQPVIPHLFDIAPDGWFSFRNHTMQQAIYDNLSRALRLKLHRAAAAYWRGQPASEEQVVSLAYHLGKCGLLPEALEVVTRAADLALENDDLDGAIDLFTHALNLFPEEKSIRLRLERLNAGDKT